MLHRPLLPPDGAGGAIDTPRSPTLNLLLSQRPLLSRGGTASRRAVCRFRRPRVAPASAPAGRRGHAKRRESGRADLVQSCDAPVTDRAKAARFPGLPSPGWRVGGGLPFSAAERRVAAAGRGRPLPAARVPPSVRRPAWLAQLRSHELAATGRCRRSGRSHPDRATRPRCDARTSDDRTVRCPRRRFRASPHRSTSRCANTPCA